MQTLLVSVDFTPVTDKLLASAATLATALGARVWIVHLAAPGPDRIGSQADPPALRKAEAGRHKGADEQVQILAERLHQQGIDASALQVQAPTVEGILDEALRVKADLIIMGLHRRGPLARLLRGSTSEKVLERTKVPVLVVPADD